MAQRRSMPRTGFVQLLSPEQWQQWRGIVSKILANPSASTLTGKDAQTIHLALTRIHSMLTPLSLDAPTVDIGRQVQDRVLNCGVLFEKQLADLTADAAFPTGDQKPDRPPGGAVRVLMSRDLKPQLFILKGFLDADPQEIQRMLGIDRDESVFMRRAVRQFLGHIEQLQDHAAARGEHGEPHQAMGHLMEIENQHVPVQLKVYYPKRKKTGGQRPQSRIALLLQMDRIGSVRADLAAVDDCLHIHFFVEDKSAQALFDSHLEPLQHTLRGFFDQVQVTIRVSENHIARFHDEDRYPGTTGRIDLTA